MFALRPSGLSDPLPGHCPRFQVITPLAEALRQSQGQEPGASPGRPRPTTLPTGVRPALPWLGPGLGPAGPGWSPVPLPLAFHTRILEAWASPPPGAAELGTFDGPRRRPGRSARGGRREPQDAQRSAEGGEAAQASRAGGAAGPWLARPVPQRQGAAPWAEGAGGSPVQRRASPGREEKSQRHWFVTLQNGGIYTSFWWRWWPRPDSGGLPWVTAAARHRRPERPARGRATPQPRSAPGSSPAFLPACQLQTPRQQPWTLTPVDKHSPGGAGPGRGLEGWGGRRPARTPPAVRSEELGRESRPGSWKGLNALFLKLSIPATPIVRASCKTSQAF